MPQGAVSDGDRGDPLQRPSNRGFIIERFGHTSEVKIRVQILSSGQ